MTDGTAIHPPPRAEADATDADYDAICADALAWRAFCAHLEARDMVWLTRAELDHLQAIERRYLALRYELREGLVVLGDAVELLRGAVEGDDYV